MVARSNRRRFVESHAARGCAGEEVPRLCLFISFGRTVWIAECVGTSANTIRHDRQIDNNVVHIFKGRQLNEYEVTSQSQDETDLGEKYAEVLASQFTLRRRKDDSWTLQTVRVYRPVATLKNKFIIRANDIQRQKPSAMQPAVLLSELSEQFESFRIMTFYKRGNGAQQDG